jgi:hypothetical protein
VYQLTNLLQKHPNMKMSVVKEVQPLLYRSNVSLRAQCVLPPSTEFSFHSLRAWAHDVLGGGGV